MNTIREIQTISKTRADRWHKGKPSWSILEWAGATNGEAGEAIAAVLELARHAGEAANAAKKIKRMEEGMQNISTRDTDMMKAKLSVMKEIADTVLYAACLANALEMDLEDVIVSVFNAKSEEYGFPEFLEFRN
jgi:NTP pyrophosphatase (non-canonical NTP hydrolase)